MFKERHYLSNKHN